MEPGSDGELVAALRRGDPAAFDAAYARYRAPVYGFLLRLARRPFLADDLLQETWLKLARHATRLRADTNLRAWLFTVARNQFRSYRRWAVLDADRLREVGLGGRAAPPSPFEDAAATETERRLEGALAALPVKYREALLLVAVEGLGQEEVAPMLGLSPENLRQRLARGRAMLRERLGAPAAAAAASGGG
ncbi:MAG TPA: RNA polymerase sigma factor [Polyangia bacterium]|jgi:RNA polymerase sigma-70 factor (ECF subfamily)